MTAPASRTESGRSAVGGAVVVFWTASLSVGLAAFVVLAAIARSASAGGVADASAVLSVSFVLAVVPGAIQLRAAATASAASGDGVAAPPSWLWWAAAALMAAAPLAAAALTVPVASLALLAAQFPLAGLAAAQRGTALGCSDLRRASASMAAEALVRVSVGVALGVAFGATGLAAALLLGTAAATVLGRRWYPGGAVMATGTVIGPAITLGVLMLFVNLDTLAAPRLLGAAADAYALAALPAKGLFFALFAASWTAVPVAARARTRRELLTPAAVVLALGLAATALVGVLRPLVVAILGEPEPTAGLLVTLAAAMSVGATLATVLAMAVARGAARAWIPALAGAAVLAGLLAATSPTPLELAQLALVSQVVVLAVTAALLLRTLPSGEGTAVRTPQGAW